MAEDGASVCMFLHHRNFTPTDTTPRNDKMVNKLHHHGTVPLRTMVMSTVQQEGVLLEDVGCWMWLEEVINNKY